MQNMLASHTEFVDAEPLESCQLDSAAFYVCACSCKVVFSQGR